MSLPGTQNIQNLIQPQVMQIQADKLRLAEQEMAQWRDKAEKLEAEAASWYEQDEGYEDDEEREYEEVIQVTEVNAGMIGQQQ